MALTTQIKSGQREQTNYPTFFFIATKTARLGQVCCPMHKGPPFSLLYVVSGAGQSELLFARLWEHHGALPPPFLSLVSSPRLQHSHAFQLTNIPAQLPQHGVHAKRKMVSFVR